MEKSLWSNVMENLVFVLVALAVAVGFVLIAYLVEKVPEKEESGQGTDTFDKKDCHDWCIFCNCNGASYI